MTASSATPLAAKLGIRSGTTLVLLGAPPDLGLEFPPGVVVKHRARGRAEVVVAFFTRLAKFDARVDALAPMIFPSGGLWIAWPKKSSAVGTDMSDHVVREAALRRGLVDNKVCAVDQTWTALRLVWGRQERTAAERH